MSKGKNLKAASREEKLNHSDVMREDVTSRKPPRSTLTGRGIMSTEQSADVPAVKETDKKHQSQPVSAIQDDWMTPQQEAELEQQMVELGKKKYGFDEPTAREWAHAFCSDSTVDSEHL